MFKTIGIAGQLNQGKDTAADYLAKRLTQETGKRWKRNAFANKVKEVFEQAFGKNRDWVEHWKRIDELPPGFAQNCRQCLIGIGDGFRKMKPDIWIEQAFHNQDCHQIISDCRYVNEIDYIRHRKGGIGILLWREGHENDLPNASEQEYMPFVKRCLTENIECKLPNDMPFDLFLRNDGDLTKLYHRIDTQVVPFIMRKFELEYLAIAI